MENSKKRPTKVQLRKLKKLFYDLMESNIRMQEIDRKIEKAIEEWLKVMRNVGG